VQTAGFGGKHTVIENESQFGGDLLHVLPPGGAAELNSVLADVTTIIVACLQRVAESAHQNITRICYW
jgi:hypothetical protein